MNAIIKNINIYINGDKYSSHKQLRELDDFFKPKLENGNLVPNNNFDNENWTSTIEPRFNDLRDIITEYTTNMFQHNNKDGYYTDSHHPNNYFKYGVKPYMSNLSL